MKIDRSQEWWLAKAFAENATVGAGAPRSLKTLDPIEFTDEEKERLRRLATREDNSPTKAGEP